LERDPAGLKGFINGLFRARGLGLNAFDLVHIPADGSLRRFFRVIDAGGGPLAVAMENRPTDDYLRRENEAYLMIGRHLRQKGVRVPEIYGVDLEAGLFLMEDVGRENLQALVLKGEDPFYLYKKVLDELLLLQLEGVRDFDPGWCCQTRTYDREVMRRNESDYFREAFLIGYIGMRCDLSYLNTSFDYIAERASEAMPRFFMHRDFQSRNIMMNEGKVGIVDWQGGRLGPLGYDLASLLIDPYAALADETRGRLYDYYRDRLAEGYPSAASELDRTYPYLALQRNMQILGAFGFLTTVRKKPHFEGYIPQAVRGLNRLLKGMKEGELTPLKVIVEELLERYP
jgi:aminoglycoside/choline kinase family phosphotransferase